MDVFSLAADSLISRLGATIQTPAGEMSALIISKRQTTRLQHKNGFEGMDMDVVNASLQVSVADVKKLLQGDTITVAEDELAGDFDIAKIESIGGGLVKLHLTEHQTGSTDEDIWR
jgi:hypothetical protein